ncbi:MarR family winged helix-turn-helix transcriptional regulator [Streptacidiphilus sp. MAP5-3]|uniref:MarR family winged helix-turn-helix transcriptional regulator n=1 Tax=unclassified Streptacidiphilus TaxID=2643834 RepID=UPI0035167BCD
MATTDPADRNDPARPADRTEPAALAVELHGVLGLIARRARAASAESELTASQRSAAARLLHEGPATTADLARAEYVRPQSMRLTLGALEERGMVHRTPHPTDGRQVLVELTDAGREQMQAVLQAKQDWLSHALATDLDEAQRATIAAALPLLRALAGEAAQA